MTIPDETLMAYADGELDTARRQQVEEAMAADPEVARRVERHQALRKKIGSEFDPVLFDTVPDSLISAVRSSPSRATREATVTDLRRVRAARAAEAKEAASARRAPSPRRPWTWVEWSAMAASIVAGAVIAHLALRSPEAERIATRNGQLVAQADLDQALTNQLAGDQSQNAPVQIGVSFKAKSGEHCRTFIVREPGSLGGLACRKGDAWEVQVLATAQPGVESPGGYKPAASMPAAVVTAVEQQIAGEPLDASGETAARESKWQ